MRRYRCERLIEIRYINKNCVNLELYYKYENFDYAINIAIIFDITIDINIYIIFDINIDI
jgi:hypothetical protein